MMTFHGTVLQTSCKTSSWLSLRRKPTWLLAHTTQKSGLGLYEEDPALFAGVEGPAMAFSEEVSACCTRTLGAMFCEAMYAPFAVHCVAPCTDPLCCWGEGVG